ncbi:MAG: MaoC family dehydratase N-terminal domain-containing protein [Burkholderiaceae bacterium]|nr:MaoC family dehydratase N-terminal domain-containing protein [Burkholderiaceae bacterium]
MKSLMPGVYWQDIAVGDRFRTMRRTITETDIINFVSVTGMLEEMFVDATFQAQGRGSIGGGRFAPAALTYTIIEGLLCQTLIQGTGLALLEVHKKVLAPVHAGDTVHAVVTIDGVRPTSKGNRAIVSATNEVFNQHGDKVMSYVAVRMLAGRDAPAG